MRRCVVFCALFCLALLAACGPGSPSITHTALLAPGEPAGQPLTGPGQEHHWTFVGEAGQVIDFSLSCGDPRPSITLQGPGGAPLERISAASYQDTAFLDDLTLPASGRYTFIVTLESEGTADYTLALYLQAATPTPPPSAAPEEPAATAPPVTSPAETVTLTGTPTETPTPAPTSTPAPPAISSGAQLEARQLYLARLDQPGQLDRYTLYGEADTVITVGALRPPGSQVDPYIELHDPSGAILDTATNTLGAPDAVLIGVTLPVTGAYTLFVRDELAQATGEYLVAFSNGLTMADRVQGQAEPEAVYSGNLDQPAIRDVWTLDLALGDVISAAVVVNDDSALDPVLEIIAPGGGRLRFDDNSGGGRSAALRQIIAPQTGRYALAISRAAEAPGLGPYTIIWRFDAQAPTQAPTFTPLPTPAPVTLADETSTLTEGARATLEFQGRAGQRVRITAVTQSQGFDPVLALFAPDGSVLGENDDSEGDLNARLTIILPRDGTYLVEVHDYLYAPGIFQFTVVEEHSP